MGIVDKLRGNMNWQNVIVISVFLGCCTAIIIVGSTITNTTLANIMVAGGLVALGIPTSFMGNLGQRVTQAAIPALNPNSNIVSKKEIDELRISIANLLNEVLLLKNKIGENNNE